VYVKTGLGEKEGKEVQGAGKEGRWVI